MSLLVEGIITLARHGVEFVVIGGMAIRTHGSSYLTQDLDICYSRDRENLRKIVEALAPVRPRPRGIPADLPFVWDVATLYNGTNFTFETTLGHIDMLAEVKGVGTYHDVVNESVVIDVGGYKVNVLSIDGLIRAKTAAGREKDVPGLKELYALKQAFSDED